MSRRFLTGLVAVAIASLGLTWLLAPVAAEVTSLWTGELPVNPYFVPDHFLRLYAALPLFAVASVLMLLAPGVLLVIARGGQQAARWTAVVPQGFLVSYGLRVFFHSVAKLAGASLTPALFWSVELALFAATASILTWRWRGGHVAVPAGPPRRLALLVAIPAVVTLVLLPQIFWQDFTEDGLEALEIGWSLKDFIVPRFPNDTGFMGLGIGMLSMAPPVSWFIQLLGPTEAAARLPLILYLPVVAFTLIGLVEHGRDRELDKTGEAMILLVLTGLVAVMAFSATYDAYAADVSAPTAFETLTLACLAGALLALWEGRRLTFFSFVILGYFARPTALMLVLLLGVVTVALYRGEDRKRMLLDIGMGLGLCVVSALVYEKLYLQWASGGSMSYGSEAVLFRYRYLRFLDVRRLLWVMVPGGFLGFLALFAFRRHDRYSRQLSAVILLYFVAFFVPAFVALHHFVPVMVLPVVVLLRAAGEAPAWFRRLALTGCVAGALLSLPRSLHVDQSSRAIGARMAFGVGDYLGTPDEHRAALDARAAVFELFPATWDVADPSRVRVGASLPFLYYSARSGVSLDDADYAILSEASAAPDGFSEAGRAGGAVAYFRSRRVWEADVADTPPARFGNPLFVLPPETLFWFVGAPAGAYDLHMGTVPVLWRFF
jgi:hypothetical protein